MCSVMPSGGSDEMKIWSFQNTGLNEFRLSWQHCCNVLTLNPKACCKSVRKSAAVYLPARFMAVHLDTCFYKPWILLMMVFKENYGTVRKFLWAKTSSLIISFFFPAPLTLQSANQSALDKIIAKKSLNSMKICISPCLTSTMKRCSVKDPGWKWFYICALACSADQILFCFG